MSNNTNNNDIDDEFGDSSFLQEMDIDEIVASSAQKKKQQQPIGKTTTMDEADFLIIEEENYNNNDNNNNNNNANNKRRKVDSNATSTTTATTTNTAVTTTTTSSSSSLSTSTSLTASSNINFQNTLEQYFGYKEFRHGQLSVLSELVHKKRDVAVFWATGSGKSLCYQIPALLLNGNDNNGSNNNNGNNNAVDYYSSNNNSVVLVISPLISLMQDQVHKLNNLRRPNIATFLGSGQIMDTNVENNLQQYRIVYITPEKLLSSSSSSNNLLLSKLPNISLIAVDEAHCVSEWGFDFRPDYRQVGQMLREHPTLKHVPILALTATAVPRVQQDIQHCLHMRDPYINKQTFDRTNLQIQISKKMSGSGIPKAMEKLLKMFISADNNKDHASKQSTIVYAPTRALVEEITEYLQRQLHAVAAAAATKIRVQAYHAGMSQNDRNETHVNFLTGQTHIVVATVAFGMGIDKPDIRHVIHYGNPKTLEEYYQQIGRAGRDGLPSTCTMYYSDSDLDRYQSDFYIGQLKGQARQSTIASMAQLKKFCLDGETCRRRALLEYFGETPSFGERCGTCDTCQNVAKFGQDAQRDFAPSARIILQAVSSLQGQSLTNILKVIGGNTVEQYRYSRGCNPMSVQQQIQAMKETLPKKLSQSFYKDLIGPMTQKGYLTEATERKNVGGYDRSWTTYRLSFQGEQVLRESLPVVLAVPDSVRQIERQEEEKRQKVLARLEQNGIPIEKLPQQEVETGDGEVIRAYNKWFSYLENHKTAGNEERVENLEGLIKAIENWRSDTAVHQRMAPASVLAEHLLLSIAYTAATLPPGRKLDVQSLEAAGVRTRSTGELASALGEWVDQVQPAKESDGLESKATAMLLAEVAPTKPWKYALYKPQKKTGMAVWEASYVRFVKGESPETISMTQPNGKPIQAKTVVGHILDALVQGRKVDCSRLASYMTAPTVMEWNQLKEAEVATGMDVTEDPKTSGKDGETFRMTDFLRPILGDRLADLPYTERTEEEKLMLGLWYDRLKWYMALRRVEYEPTFGES